MLSQSASTIKHLRIGILGFLRFLRHKLGFCEAILLVSIITYIIFFSYVTICRMQALQTYAYDLGIYNQALYTTLTRKGLLYYTADLRANPTGSIFGVHISIILLLMLPIYALSPAPETLLVIQSLLLAMGAFPIYMLAKLKLNSKNLGLIFALAYLLNPGLQGINWYDFHPEAFILLPMFFAMYFSEKDEWVLYFLSLTFVLFAIDKAAMIVGGFALYKLISLKKTELIIKRNPLSSPLFVYTVTFVMAVAWFFFTASLVSVFNPFNLYVNGGSEYWSSLGARNLIEIPIRVVSHPSSVISALEFEWNQKLFYVVVLLGPVLFLPFVAPKTLLVLLPWLSTSLLSNFSPYYQLGTQYPAYVIPAIFYGGIIGASKLVNRFEKSPFLRKVSKNLGHMVLATSLIFLVLSGPLAPIGIGRYPFIAYGFPETSSHSRFVADFINIIPKNASVLVQNNIFPLVSNRENAYVMPASVFYPPGTSFLNTLTQMLEGVDYILMDSKTGVLDVGILLSQPIVKDDFGLLASGDGVILLKRGYIEKPTIFEPFNATFNFRNLVPFKGVTTTASDPQSRSQIVLFHSGVTNDDFWYGPYISLPPGKYQAVIRLKIEQQVNGEVLTLRVSSSTSTIWGKIWGNNVTGYHIIFSMNQTGIKREHASELLYGESFAVGKYEEFPIDFEVKEFGVYEFTGVKVATSVGLYLDEVRVSQIEPGYKFDTDLRFYGSP